MKEKTQHNVEIRNITEEVYNILKEAEFQKSHTFSLYCDCGNHIEHLNVESRNEKNKNAKQQRNKESNIRCNKNTKGSETRKQ